MLALLKELQGRDDPDTRYAAEKTLLLLGVGGAGPAPKATVNSSQYLTDAQATSARDQEEKRPPAVLLQPVAKLPCTGPSGSKASSGPGEVLREVERLSKLVPFFSCLITPNISFIRGLISQVEQVRVNKAKAASIGKRVDALVAYLQSMMGNVEQLQLALEKQPQQLRSLESGFQRLSSALEVALDLVRKWSRPMRLKYAVRFLKENLDKDDIRDVENGINKAVQDLTNVVTSLNLLQTVAIQQQLQQVLTSSIPLEEAQKQDLAALRGHLEVLVGGSTALQEQLEEATEDLKQQWAELELLLSQLSADVGDIKQELAAMHQDMQQHMSDIKHDVDQLVVYMRELRMVPAAAATAANSRSEQGSTTVRRLLHSRLLLDRSQVQWEERPGSLLDSGGFASVYRGSYDGRRVAIKKLDITACADKEEEELCYEAAVLSRLHHPCIVSFYGLVVDGVREPSDSGRAAPAGRGHAAGGPLHFHDSVGSLCDKSADRSSLRSLLGGSGSGKGKLAVALVMEHCDSSLDKVLQNVAGKHSLYHVLHVASGIAGGVKYLHEDSRITVIHGDLKPANVLIKGDDEVKLTDFGLSKTIAIQTATLARSALLGKDSISSGSSFHGTLYGTAPELLAGWDEGKPTPRTTACDIYAFGLILYELLVGRAPFQSMFDGQAGIAAFVAAVTKGRRPNWGSWLQERAQANGEPVDVLEALQKLAEACWSALPFDRPTAKQLHGQLLSLMQQSGV
eukprot:gene13138-13268_t